MRRLLLSILLSLSVQCGFAVTLDNIVIFGDSLSDTGNLYEYMKHQLPQSPPYYTGHFSDGPIWVEYLMKHYFENADARILNYAFGGAGVLNDNGDDDDVFFTLNREIDTYLLSHADIANPQSLFIVWIGGNNYLGAPDNADEVTEQVKNGIQKGLERLVQAGAKHILLMNLPDLSRTPLAQELEAEQSLETLSVMHNDKLFGLFKQMQQQIPAVQWMFFDVNKVFVKLTNHYREFGFDYLHETCYDALIQPNEKTSLLKMVASVHAKNASISAAHPTCERYFFFDLVHPTTQVHQLTSQYLFEKLDQEHIAFKGR